MSREDQIVGAVGRLYSWIDSRIAESGQGCDACGRCCDFGGFDHRLFVTTAELIYFLSRMSPTNIMPMPTGACPYNVEGKCSVYDDRFAACRIFTCKGDSQLQSELSEQASDRLKDICRRFGIGYGYMEISKALNGLCDGDAFLSEICGVDQSSGRG